MDLKMENQQTFQAEKVNLDLWFDHNISLAKDNVSYNFHGEPWEYDYYHTILIFLIDHIKSYSNIQFKNIGDNVDRDRINVFPIVCPDLPNLNHALINLDSHVYDFCKTENIYLLFILSRETIQEHHARETADIIKTHIINKGYSSSIVKIAHVAFDTAPELNCVKDYIINLDWVNNFLADYNTRLNTTTFELPETRSYNFSLLTGQIKDRPYRSIFLARCFERQLLDDKFFYTMFFLNEESDIPFIKNEFKNTVYESIINQACDNIFKNYTVDTNGSTLQDKNIYDNMIEYTIPQQVLDSYINIVLETQIFSPCLTEKIYKPLMSGMLFLWHGPPNTLEYLESRGFKRYKYIDYSFDSHPVADTRLNLLVNEIQRLSKKDLKALTELNQPIIDHNKKRFWELASNMNVLWDQLK